MSFGDIHIEDRVMWVEGWEGTLFPIDSIPDAQRFTEALAGDTVVSPATTQEVQTPMDKPASQSQLDYLESLCREMHRLSVKMVELEVPNCHAINHTVAEARVAVQRNVEECTFTGGKEGTASQAIDYVRELNGKLRTHIATSAAKGLVKTPPVAPAGTTTAVTGSGAVEPGMYRTRHGVIYKVQKAVHGSGRPYAKKLEITKPAEHDADGKVTTPAEVTFIYSPGAVRSLTADDKMSLEEAKKFGALYGTCCQCGRTLTKEESIEAGIGPVCAGKFS